MGNPSLVNERLKTIDVQKAYPIHSCSVFNVIHFELTRENESFYPRDTCNITLGLENCTFICQDNK